MAKTRPADSIVEEIAAGCNRRPGFAPWWERVTPEQEETLGVIWAAWLAGRFGQRKLTAAKAISKAIADIGVAIGYQGVLRWLDRTT
jgi:hypothetical protein